jgi:hypothetical protein
LYLEARNEWKRYVKDSAIVYSERAKEQESARNDRIRQGADENCELGKNAKPRSAQHA